MESKRYNIIYLDPPWHYNDNAAAGERGASFKYEIMTDGNVKNIDLPSIMADDCAVFMWITMPKLDVAFDVFKAWGLKYKTAAFTWVKKNKNKDTWFTGMGHYTRANTELCLLATKGHIKVKSHSVRQIVDTPIEAHSKKPDVVRDRIVELLGDLPRIELFARDNTPGWDVCGLECHSTVEVPGIIGSIKATHQ